MANEAKTAEATATSNAVITVEAQEVPIQEPSASAQLVISLPNGGVLRGEDIFMISTPSIKQYPEFKAGTTKLHTYSKEDYYLFPINGKVFTTRDKYFAEMHKSGGLYSVTIGERTVGTATYLELLNYVTKAQKSAQIDFDEKVKKSEFSMKRLDSFDHSKSNANADVVQSLLAGV